MGIKSDAIKMADRKELSSTSDFSGDPYAHLAAAIIIKAFEDLKRLEGEEKSYFEGSPVAKDDLLNFLCSKWCGRLLSFQNTIRQSDLVQAALRICE